MNDLTLTVTLNDNEVNCLEVALDHFTDYADDIVRDLIADGAAEQAANIQTGATALARKFSDVISDAVTDHLRPHLDIARWTSKSRVSRLRGGSMRTFGADATRRAP